MCPAAASTLVLWNQLARWELNPRPASYKDAALTAELRASERVGPEGVEPTPCGLKVRRAASYTTTLKAEAYAFAAMDHIGLLLSFSVAISGSPGNRTQRALVISRGWATSPRLPSCSEATRMGIEPISPP